MKHLLAAGRSRASSLESGPEMQVHQKRNPMLPMSRRTFVGAAASGLGEAMLERGASQQNAGQRLPNIVFICSDEHSGLVLGAQGHPLVQTPNLDRLAAMGVNFRNAYCCSPVCVPARASLMTGRFASDVGSYCNSTVFDGRVPTWGERLRRQGYYCWATGKMDLQQGREYGFREVQTTHEHTQDPDITSFFRAPVCFRATERKNVNGAFNGDSNADSEVTKRALSFLREESPKLNRPWALYLGLITPHPLWVAKRKYLDVYPPDKVPLPSMPAGYLERRHSIFQVMANFKNISIPLPDERIRRARAAYYGVLSEMDEYIGWLIDELVRTSQLENTLVVYTSDHGEMLGEHGLWFKNVLLEGAARVPMILAGAGLPRGVTINMPVSHVDLVATLLAFAGVAPVSGLRGHSLLPLVSGESRTGASYSYSESHSEGNCTGSFMLRRGDWKYIHVTGDHSLLFNLKDDPGEFQNLSGKPDTTDVERGLRDQLCSLVDPDAVTRRAFEEQERRLDGMIRRMNAEEFYKQIVGRLGPAQAWALTNRYYRRSDSALSGRARRRLGLGFGVRNRKKVY